MFNVEIYVNSCDTQQIENVAGRPRSCLLSVFGNLEADVTRLFFRGVKSLPPLQKRG